MQHIATHEAKNIQALIESVHASNEPLMLVGDGKNTVMISEEEWSSIQETLYLSSIPGMKESIVEGMNTPVSECNDKLSW